MTTRRPSGVEASWRPVDFRPAPDGWRVVYLLRDGTAAVGPLVGWLIEEETWYRADDFTDVPFDPDFGDRDRRVVAADYDPGGGAEPMPVTDLSGFWRLLPPGAPEPTDAEIAAKREEVARLAAAVKAAQRDQP